MTGLLLAVLGAQSAEVATMDERGAHADARQRFVERMGELDADTRAYVDLREEEERAAILAELEPRLAELRSAERVQRETAITNFELFLSRYPHTAYASHVRFRLADLLYERASERWQEEAATYFEQLDNPDLSEEELEALGEQPLRDLSESLSLYQTIIDDNLPRSPRDRYERLDGTYLMMGFVYNDSNNVQYDEALAKQAFADIIAVTADSELADRAHLFLGNFAFADNLYDEAIAHYEAVYEKGAASKYYMEGLYQLAWARYKLNEFDSALALFTELLDASHQQKLDTGRVSAFAPDARRFMAFSFADLGYDLDEPAEVIAQRYFTKIGARPFERDVFIELADVLLRYTRPEEAMATYDVLQNDERWTMEPDNPKHQIELIKQLQSGVARDLQKAGEERLEFIERYVEGSAWWDANRSDPEALAVARSFIESSLLDVAIEYRVRAQDSGSPEEFLLAASKYRAYVDRFPISDDYYKQAWFLADSLKLGQDYDGALAEYASLFKSRRYHPYGDAALYSTMDVRYQLMTALGHDPNAPPAEPVVERTEETAFGETVEVLALSDERIAFIDAADRVVQHTFSEAVDPDLPDYASEVENKRPSLMYLTSQILFHHRRYADARKRFESLIADYPRSIEANYAAGLLVDSYLAEGDLEQVRQATMRFTVNPPGPATDIDPERFRGTLEGSTFQLAMSHADRGDNMKAAEAFLAFREEFPSSEFDSDALYNAAFYYQRAGKIEQSNAMYEQFVQDYPKDKRSLGLLFRIAANYESAFELAKAEDYYDRLLDHPDASSSEQADAQFNRSFLLIGLKRHREAAEGFEIYEAKYPDQQDREAILWLAGEQWEAVGADEALAFYRRYLRKYPSENPDHVIESQYKIGQLLRQQGARLRQVNKQDQVIVDTFDKLAAAGAEIGANGHRYAAATAFPTLERTFAAFSADQLTGNETRDAALLNQTKPAQLKDLEAEIKTFIDRYRSFEYVSGALLLQGQAALYFADLGLSIQCPSGMAEEDCWLYEDILQEKVFPQYYEIEEVGLRRLEQLTDAAKEQKRHSRFIDAAYNELNRRRPSDFPAIKNEIQGGTDSSIPVELVPRTLDGLAELPPAPSEEAP
ncbi:MAG: tetratricopeptide repeat protein [Myxococcota bacterium]